MFIYQHTNLNMLVHTNNQYILISICNSTVTYKLHYLNDIYKQLYNIYPKSICSDCKYHFILDTCNRIHMIIEESAIIFHENIGTSTLNNQQFSCVWVWHHDDIFIAIGQYDKYKKCYYSEYMELCPATNTISADIEINDNINECHFTDLDNVVLFKNNHEIFIKGELTGSNVSYISSTINNIIKNCHTKIIQYESNNILFEESLESHGNNHINIIIDLNKNNIKDYFYNFCILCYIDNNNEIYIMDPKKLDTSPVFLGSINDNYIKKYIHKSDLLCFLNKNMIVLINMVYDKRIDIDSVFDISFAHMISLNNFIWSFATHKFLGDSYKKIINILLLCNKQLKNLKIPKYVMYVIFKFFCNQENYVSLVN